MVALAETFLDPLMHFLDRSARRDSQVKVARMAGAEVTASILPWSKDCISVGSVINGYPSHQEIVLPRGRPQTDGVALVQAIALGQHGGDEHRITLSQAIQHGPRIALPRCEQHGHFIIPIHVNR